jgi:hypothetical protein
VRGWEAGTCMKLPFGWILEAYSGTDLEIDYSVTYCSQTGKDIETYCKYLNIMLSRTKVSLIAVTRAGI